jgi:hypothetical protein
MARVATKAVLVVSGLFLTRLFYSCCDCNETPIPFDFDAMAITNLDNSGERPQPSSTNTMLANAVAFEVTISTTQFLNPARKAKCNCPGFSSARAMECDCEIPYAPRQTIVDISVTTEYRVSATIAAGSRIPDESLVFLDSKGFSPTLYLSKSDILTAINPGTLYDLPMIRFRVFLKDCVENGIAQFTIAIGLSDGRTLTAQTNPITIV